MTRFTGSEPLRTSSPALLLVAIGTVGLIAWFAVAAIARWL